MWPVDAYIIVEVAEEVDVRPVEMIEHGNLGFSIFESTYSTRQ